MSLTTIFLLVSLLFGVLMFLQAYGWNWKLWQCIAFAVGTALLMLILLFACKNTAIKIVGKLSTLAHKLMDLL